MYVPIHNQSVTQRVLLDLLPLFEEPFSFLMTIMFSKKNAPDILNENYLKHKDSIIIISLLLLVKLYHLGFETELMEIRQHIVAFIVKKITIKL